MRADVQQGEGMLHFINHAVSFIVVNKVSQCKLSWKIIYFFLISLDINGNKFIYRACNS